MSTKHTQKHPLEGLFSHTDPDKCLAIYFPLLENTHEPSRQAIKTFDDPASRLPLETEKRLFIDKILNNLQGSLSTSHTPVGNAHRGVLTFNICFGNTEEQHRYLTADTYKSHDKAIEAAQYLKKQLEKKLAPV